MHVQSANRTEVNVLATALDMLYEEYQMRLDIGDKELPLTLDELDELCRMRNMIDVMQAEFRGNDELDAVAFAP